MRELKRLEKLLLYQNEIEAIPSSIENLQNLHQLDLSQNKIKIMPYSFYTIFKINGIRLILDTNPWCIVPTEEDRDDIKNRFISLKEIAKIKINEESICTQELPL